AHEIRRSKQRDRADTFAQGLQASDRQVSGISRPEANDPNQHAKAFEKNRRAPFGALLFSYVAEGAGTAPFAGAPAGAPGGVGSGVGNAAWKRGSLIW